MAVDPETTPLLAKGSDEGHRIGASDEKNFEFGLDCILARAERLIGAQPKTSQRRKPVAPPRKARGR